MQDTGSAYKNQQHFNTLGTNQMKRDQEGNPVVEQGVDRN